MAEVCISAVDSGRRELNVGGPETLTFRQIAELAFDVLGKPSKVTQIPLRIGKLGVSAAKLIGLGKVVGPFDFFVAASAIDMRAPTSRLAEFARAL